MNTRLTLTLSVIAVLGALHAAPGEAQEKGKPAVIEAARVDLGGPASFDKDVLPILEQNCIACHNLAIDEGKLSLEDVESILKGGKRGPSVVAGKPDESLVFLFASHAKNPVMPPPKNKVEATPLTPRELGILKKWIEEGAKASGGDDATTLTWSPLPEHLRPVYSLAISPWADTVAVGRANRVVLYDPSTGTELARLSDPALAALEADGRPMYGDGIAHRDFVHDIAFNPDGSLIATAGYRVVKLWQRNGPTAGNQQSVGGAVTAIAVSDDGKLAAIGSDDKSIKLWSLADNKVTKTFAGHAAAVTGLGFTPDGAKLVSGSTDKTIRVWDIAAGNEVAKLELPVESNNLCLNGDGTQIVSADQDNKLRVWAIPTPPAAPAEGQPKEGEEQKPEPPKPIRELAGHGGPVTSVKLIGKGPQIVSGGRGGQVRTWDSNSGAGVRSMNHGSPILDVAATDDGQQIASAAENGTTRVWNGANGQQIAETQTNPEAARVVTDLTEEQTVAKQKVALADAASKAAEKNRDDRKKALEAAEKAKPEAEKAFAEAKKKSEEADKKRDEAKKKLDEKPDDNNLKKALQNAETEAQKQKDELTKAQTAVDAANRAIELAKKSVETSEEKLKERQQQKTVADESQKKVDGELEAAKKVAGEAAKPVRAVVFTSTGQLATAGDDNRIRIWGAASGRLVLASEPRPSAVTLLVPMPDGRVLAGSADKTASAWDLTPSWKLVATLGPDGGDPMKVGTSKFVDRVLALAFSPDGKFLATGGGDPSRSGELLLWDVEKRAVAKEFPEAHSDTILDLEFSRDGRWLVTGASDKFVKLFDVPAGTFVRSYEGHTHHVLGVSIKADNATLVSAGADQQIKVWNRETGEQSRTITNYGKEVTSIDFIGVGENTVSSGGDKTVRLHRASNGQNYRSLSGNTDFVYVAVAARDESLIVAGGADGIVRVWSNNGQLLQSIEPPKVPSGEQQAAR